MTNAHDTVIKPTKLLKPNNVNSCEQSEQN